MKKVKLISLAAAALLAVSPVVAVSVSATSSSSVVNAAKKVTKKHKHVVKRKKHKRVIKHKRNKRSYAASMRAEDLRDYGPAFKPYRTIDIQVKKSSPWYNAIIQGIKAWNDTGVYHFEITNDESANITFVALPSSELYNTLAFGETVPLEGSIYSKYLTKRENKMVEFYDSVIRLNSDCNDSLYDSHVRTVEHELGHAIGMDHYEGKDDTMSVMSPYTFADITKPTPYDIAKTKQMYKEK